MSKKKLKTFVINDESKVNSYGFRTLNKGIVLKRFKKNPVMLNMHNTWSNVSVIGRWVNIRIEGVQLLADAEFDLEDADAAKIEGKVNRGFLKGCSMGLDDFKGNFEIEPTGSHVLKKCELMEVSIVSIPSNSNAVRLYAESGKPMDDGQIRLSIPTSSNTGNLSNNNTMNSIKLSAGALLVLGIDSSDNDLATAQAVEKLVDDHKQLKLDHEKLTDQRESEIKLSAQKTVAKAVEQGKIPADKTEDWVQMAVSNPTLFESTLASIPAKQELTPKNLGSGEVKSEEDFQKLSAQEQIKFKENNPDAYKKLFAAG